MAEEIKIALIGSAPASVRLAPYHDESWKIWGCSPGVYGIAPRTDVWFELHRYEPGQTWFSAEYCLFLQKYKGVVFMAEKRAEIPNSETLPVDGMVEKYGPYFFTSSLAWMMALAIDVGATKIGLWGVDMAANEEYGDQRAGLHYFAMVAASRGIEVGIPPESDLFTPRPLYGISELDHGQIKLTARRRELETRLAEAQQQLSFQQGHVHFLQGALDDLNYHRQTWADRRKHVSPVLPSVLPLPNTVLGPKPELAKQKRSRKPKAPAQPPPNGQDGKARIATP